MGLPTMPEMLIVMAFYNQCVSLNDSDFEEPMLILPDGFKWKGLTEFGFSNIYLSHIPKEVYLLYR